MLAEWYRKGIIIGPELNQNHFSFRKEAKCNPIGIRIKSEWTRIDVKWNGNNTRLKLGLENCGKVDMKSDALIHYKSLRDTLQSQSTEGCQKRC
jgi:hypothetical protein